MTMSLYAAIKQARPDLTGAQQARLSTEVELRYDHLFGRNLVEVARDVAHEVFGPAPKRTEGGDHAA
jgi:hypothetical protein